MVSLSQSHLLLKRALSKHLAALFWTVLCTLGALHLAACEKALQADRPSSSHLTAALTDTTQIMLQSDQNSLYALTCLRDAPQTCSKALQDPAGEPLKFSPQDITKHELATGRLAPSQTLALASQASILPQAAEKLDDMKENEAEVLSQNSQGQWTHLEDQQAVDTLATPGWVKLQATFFLARQMFNAQTAKAAQHIAIVVMTAQSMLSIAASKIAH